LNYFYSLSSVMSLLCLCLLVRRQVGHDQRCGAGSHVVCDVSSLISMLAMPIVN
jgi:hypothetical protein